MKILVLFHSLDGPGPVWRNGFWPMINVLSKVGDVELLETPWPSQDGERSPLNRTRFWLRQRAAAKALAGRLSRTDLGDDTTLLFAIALRASQVRLARLAVSGNRAITHRVLYVVENIEPEQAPLEAWRTFDRILCFCPDLARRLQEKTGIRTLYWPPHTDALGLHSGSDFRPIDVLSFGRNRTDVLFALQRRFLQPEKRLIFIDFVTRPHPYRRQSAEREFRLLSDALSKSRATLCFAAHDVARFSGRSPLLARWVYAWVAGCVVFGTRPTGTGVDRQMDWPGSTIDLPQAPEEAADLIETKLSDDEAIRTQRRLNVYEALRRHDTRYRLEMLCEELGYEVPAALGEELERLSEAVERARVATVGCA